SLTAVRGSGDRSAVHHRLGAHAGPVVQPLRIGDRQVDAAVRAGVPAGGAPRRAVEPVPVVEVLHPGDVRGVVVLRMALVVVRRVGHVLAVVAQVDLVGAGGGLVALLAVDHRARAPDGGVADVGGD